MEIFIAVYISGVLTAMYGLYWPAFKIVQAVNPDNLLVKHWLRATIIVFLFFLVTFPVLVIALIFPEKTKRFIEGFAKGVLK